MKINKELILEEAFGLFYIHGYKEMSISILQEKMNIGRASLYYYFRNKEELLLCSIEEYYIKKFDSFYESLNDDITIDELIDKFVEYYKNIYDLLTLYSDEEYLFSKLNSLLIYAAAHFPAIKEKLKETRIRKFQLWKRAVEVSHKRKLIKQDIDIDLISSIFSGITYEPSKNPEKPAADDITSLDGYRRSCLLLLDLIKTDVWKENQI